MAKGEARNWKAFIPSVSGVVKFFVLSLVLHMITSVVYPKLPANVQGYWPRT